MVPTGAGLRVLEGWIAFDVDPVAEHAQPVRIDVPGGSIEVLGTRFSIWTDGSRGHVDLIEGHVRFHDAAGVQALRPGERVTFDTEAEATDATQPPPPPPPASGALVEPLRQLARLRATGRHGEALELVESLLARAKDPERAEALSFEKGTLLQAMGRRTTACKHFTKHLARFPDGRYARAVARHQHMLHCAS